MITDLLKKLPMTLTIHTEPVPLRTDEYGDIRVGNCQVLLDTVIRRFEEGASAEAIAHAHSTLSLADVYAVLGYYLRHKEEVDAYLRAREEAADRLQKEIEAKQPQQGLRARLLARRSLREQEHASPRQ